MGRQVREAGRVWYVRRADVWEVVKSGKGAKNIGFIKRNSKGLRMQ